MPPSFHDWARRTVPEIDAALAGHQRPDCEPEHEDPYKPEDQRLPPAPLPRRVAGGYWERQNEEHAVEDVQVVPQTGSHHHQTGADQALKDKEELRHDQRGAVAAARRLPSEVGHKPPAGHDQAHQEARPKEPLMDDLQQIQGVTRQNAPP